MEVKMNVSGVHHHHHQQEISSQTLESMLMCTKSQDDKKPRPPAEEPQKCPRCDSINTKFCYYNNYSLTQPRYFCKSCRRYWTKGGTLRNVPVGGGCRRNKRSSSSSATSSATSSSSSALLRPQLDHQHNNPLFSGLSYLPYDSTSSTDLSLAFARLQSQTNGHHMGYDQFDHNTPGQLGFLESITNTNSLNGFHNVLYNEGNYGNIHDQDQEIMNPIKILRSSEVGDSRSGGGVLWGFPWQIGGDEGNMVNVIGSTNWHGLINSPLM